MNTFGTKDLTALAATLSPVAPPAREAPIATAPYSRFGFHEDLANHVCAAAFATDVLDAVSTAEHVSGSSSVLKGARQGSEAAPREKLRIGIGCQDDLASVEALTVASRQTRDRSDIASCTSRRLLVGAHRDLREPLTAMLRLNSDWNARGTEMVAVRMIEQQHQALAVMADLIDGLLTIAEPDTVRQPALLTVLASQSAGGKLCVMNATPERRAEEWSAEWAMTFAGDRPAVPAVIGTACRKHRVLLIDEDRGALCALRIYLLCAGYRVIAVPSVDKALDRARIGTSIIDIIIATSVPAGDDDGLAVIDKARLALGSIVPAVLLTTQASIEIGRPELVTDVSLLRKPVNVDELNALIGEVLKRPRRSRLTQLRTTGANLGHDEPSPEIVR